MGPKGLLAKIFVSEKSERALGDPCLTKKFDEISNRMKMPAPKISVLMITYNHSRYVAQAIESVLAQQTTFEFDLVIGEDCSRDETRKICESYAARNKNISLLDSDKNLGMMQNFLRTLSRCRGEYIAFCEGDDYWLSTTKLQEQAAILDEDPSISGCAHQSIIIKNGREMGVFRRNVPKLISWSDLLHGRLFHTASLLFRRKAAERMSLAPPVYSGDRLMNFCIAADGKIYFSEKPICAYRILESGASSNTTVGQHLRDLDCVDYLKEIINDFPAIRYASYIYATAAMTPKANLFQKLFYLAVSFTLSFSYFPKNLSTYLGYCWREFAKLTCKCSRGAASVEK
jgi:glycosyltransferase involved in cell wall biosynthesis